MGLVHAVAVRVAPRYGVDARDVEDAVQEVYVRLLRNDFHLLRTFDASRAPLASFLTVVTRSVVHERGRRRRLPISPGVDPASVNRPAGPGADGADGREGWQQLPWHALSPQQREVLELVFDGGLSVEQVAQRLGINPQTVRSAKHKGLERLRQELTRIRGDEPPPGRIPPQESNHGPPQRSSPQA